MITPAYSPTATERVLPRMALDFTTGVLDSRVTVTRALNTATRINSSGLVEIVNANLPRFDYDPATLQPRGLLIEETRINHVLYSEDFTQVNWSKLVFGVGVLPVVTPNYEVAPNGTNTATRLQLNADANGLSDYSLLRQFPIGLGGTVSRSIWAKSNTGSNQVIAIVATDAATKVTVTPTWQRLILPNSSSGAQQFDISVGGSALTPATADISIWGAQLEASEFATSYIPTTTLAVTRNADQASMTGANFSDWYNAGSGAILARSRQSVITGTRPSIYISDGTADNIIALRGNAANPELYIKATTDQAQIDAGTLVANTSYGLAGAWNTDNCAAAINGAAPVTDTSATIPTVDRMLIGSDGTDYLNGNIEKISYWPQRITNPETQAFSK